MTARRCSKEKGGYVFHVTRARHKKAHFSLSLACFPYSNYVTVSFQNKRERQKGVPNPFSYWKALESEVLGKFESEIADVEDSSEPSD